MMNNYKAALLLTVFVSFGTSADTDGIAFFEKKIRPVLVESCYKCHSAAEKVKAGLHLDYAAGLLKGGEAGPAIVPGDPDKSLLIKAIRYHDENLEMPPKKKLPDAVIADFEAWVKRGAPDPRTEEPPKKKGIDPQLIANHWSYKKLERPTIPKVKEKTWIKNPIDNFIKATLEKKSIPVTAAADRRILIRRLYLDITGIPPTPSTIDEFIADTSDNALEKVVDHLLASPRFGERWARHWLDLARFAESHGYEQDYDRPFAYHYRDFVIRALNADMPYDQFVRWQLAGDEIAPDNTEALRATGFIAAGVWPTQITKNEAEKARYDALDDMLSTTFSTVLGTTVGCARCHDHKYDPISQRDYYHLLSTFTTTVRSEVERDVTPALFEKEVEAFEKAHQPYEDTLIAYENNKLLKKLAAAEKELAGKASWLVAVASSSTASSKAKFTPQNDGSLLVSGKASTHDTYTIVINTEQKNIRGLRIDALRDPSLPKGGPGRAGNGNFCLTNVAVTARDKKADKKSKPIPITLINPQSTFDQPGLPVSATIDDDSTSGWAVDPQFGQDHAAVYTFAQPLENPHGATITIELSFQNNSQHAIGRSRFSFTSEDVALAGGIMHPAIYDALRVPITERTDEHNKTLMTWIGQQDDGWRALRKKADEHLAKKPQRTVEKILIGSEGVKAVRLHTQGADFFNDTYFLRRGDPDQKKDIVQQSFWPVFMNNEASAWQTAPPKAWHTSYRRRALSDWIMDVEKGSGRLAARVLVNRLWQHLFGKALAATPSDIGLNGAKPTHPELIDWMASELIAGDWKIKPLIRSIVLSATYQQGSEVSAATKAADPEATWFSSQHRRRLEAEAIRDSLLFISSMLDETPFGAGTRNESSRRRSIYFTIKRSALIPFLTTFDFPEPLQSVDTRPTTTIAPQALALLNNPQTRLWADGFASRITGEKDDAALIDKAWLLALGRLPSAYEKQEAQAFIKKQTSVRNGDRRLALTDFAHTVLCLNDVIYVY